MFQFSLWLFWFSCHIFKDCNGGLSSILKHASKLVEKVNIFDDKSLWHWKCKHIFSITFCRKKVWYIRKCEGKKPNDIRTDCLERAYIYMSSHEDASSFFLSFYKKNLQIVHPLTRVISLSNGPQKMSSLRTWRPPSYIVCLLSCLAIGNPSRRNFYLLLIQWRLSLIHWKWR